MAHDEHAPTPPTESEWVPLVGDIIHCEHGAPARIDLSRPQKLSVVQHSDTSPIDDIRIRLWNAYKRPIFLYSNRPLGLLKRLDGRLYDIATMRQRALTRVRDTFFALKTFTWKKRYQVPNITPVVSIADSLPVKSASWVDLRYGTYRPRLTLAADFILPDHYQFHRARRFARRHRGLFGRFLAVLLSVLLLLSALFAVGISYSVYAIRSDIESLMEAWSQRDIVALTRASERLASHFDRTRRILSPLTLLAAVPLWQNNDIIMADQALAGAHSLAEGFHRALVVVGHISTGSGLGIDTGRLLESRADITAIARYMQSGRETLRRSLEWWQGAYASDERIVHGMALVESTTRLVNILDTHFLIILEILGHDRPQRFLVLNQNRDEIRALGGFPGSVISFTLDRWTLISHQKKDIYFYDWHLYPNKIAPPPGISELTDTFGMRDANYWPDLAKSFDQINFFYEKSGGDSLDTIIFLHQGLIEELLAITGPIAIPESSILLDASNFSRTMSALVETKTGKKTSPKDILFLWMESFFDRIVHSDMSVIIPLIDDFIARWEIKLVSRIEGSSYLQASLSNEAEGWKTDPGNWIMPIFTSLSGNKSDRYVERSVRVTTTSQEACIATNVVTLVSKHNFSVSEELAVREIFATVALTDDREIERQMFVQGKGDNRQFVRWYLPSGAILLDSNLPMKSSIENAITVLSHDFKTPLSGNNTLTFTYQVPIKNCLLKSRLYRQSGLKNFTFTSL